MMEQPDSLIINGHRYPIATDEESVGFTGRSGLIFKGKCKECGAGARFEVASISAPEPGGTVGMKCLLCGAVDGGIIDEIEFDR